MKIKVLVCISFLWLMSWGQAAVASPKIEHWTTDNGLRVYYVGVSELPMLDLRVVFAAGSARDGEQSGIASLTSSMLDQGAGELNADQLASAFESVGAQLGSGSARDMAWLSLRTLTLEAQKNKALETWLTVLSKPSFPEKEFNNLQKLTLVGLEAKKQSPSSLASEAFYKHLYGKHPYAKPSSGTEKSVTKLTTEQLQQFYKQYYVARNAVLAIVGNVDRTEAEAIAAQVDSVLEAGEKAPALADVKPLEKSNKVAVKFPSGQSHILIGQIGNKRGDPDYYKLYLGNHILGGGGFTSRLMQSIRNDRGLSYSVYSYFLPMEQLGPFQIGLQTKQVQTQEALEVVREVVKKFREKGPSDKELTAAKKDITGGFPLRTASNSDIVEYLGMIGFYQLPLDYLETFTETINAISREDIVDAFQRRVDPEKMLTIVVGQAEK